LREWQVKHLGGSKAPSAPTTDVSTPIVARETVVADAPATSRPKL